MSRVVGNAGTTTVTERSGERMEAVGRIAEHGQALVDYAAAVAVIAMVAVVALLAFGGQTSRVLSTVSGAV